MKKRLEPDLNDPDYAAAMREVEYFLDPEKREREAREIEKKKAIRVPPHLHLSTDDET